MKNHSIYIVIKSNICCGNLIKTSDYQIMIILKIPKKSIKAKFINQFVINFTIKTGVPIGTARLL